MDGEMPTMKVEENISSLPGETEVLEGDKSESTSTSEKEEVIYNEPEKDVSSNINTPLVPKAGIVVVATRKGFFGQLRVMKGDKFTVKRFEDLGEWMKCEDPVIERDRVKFFKNKKAKK